MHDRFSRRTFLGATTATLAIAKPPAIAAAAQTNAWAVDPKNFSSLLETLAEVKRLGFEGFETGYANVRGQFEKPEAARSRIRKTGLRFFGVHVFLKSYDPQTGIAPWSLLSAMAEGGAAVGAERLVVSGASVTHPLVREAKIEALNKIVNQCREYGIGCAYHNHQAEFENQGEQIHELIRRCDSHLQLVLDAGHAVRAGADVAAFFGENWRRIDGIHLRDSQRGEEVPFGKGDHDWAPFAKAIRASQWRGWLISEEERISGEKPGAAAVGPARAAIREIFGV